MKQHVNMVVDVGNTFIKVGTFKAETLIHTESFSVVEDVRSAILKTDPEQVLVSSVRGDAFWNFFQDIKNVFKLDVNTRLPINFDYESRSTLGTDRIAAAVGSYTLFPDQTNLFLIWEHV